MLNTAKLMAFSATTDPARARAFYEGMLGLTFISEESFALVFDSNATILRVAKAQKVTPAHYTVLGWEVADILAAMAELRMRGVVFEHYEWFPQKDSDIFTYPDGAQVAWFKDPDGNLLSLTQFA